VGNTRWRFFQHSGTGFSQTGADCALPPLDTGSSSAQPSSYLSCPTTGTLRFSTIDLDSDGKPDLVVTQSCSDNAVGKTRWRWFQNGGGGFAQTGADFALPPLDTGFAYDQPSDYFSCPTTGTLRFNTMDLDGDGRLDVTITQSCADAQVSKTRWRRFAVQCN